MGFLLLHDHGAVYSKALPNLEAHRCSQLSKKSHCIKMFLEFPTSKMLYCSNTILYHPIKNQDHGHLRVQRNLGKSRTGYHWNREAAVVAPATKGSGQAFPSQNGGGERPRPTCPNPEIEPADVIQTQLKALREQDFALVYEFASPANKRHTGPLTGFVQMLQGKAYGLMVGHIRAEVLSSVSISPTRFQQRIRFKGANGSEATFAWSLSKQEESPYEGCWMTDTVRRDD